MMNDDTRLTRAGRALGALTAGEQERARMHAGRTHGTLATHERAVRRRAVQRRRAGRAAGGVAIAASVLVVARFVDRSAVPIDTAPSGGALVEFMFDGDRATHVTLVGEFNEWNARATPMQRAPDGRWRVALAVPPGRHTYAFVVNDSVWTADPTAPRAPERWFDSPRSVLVVGDPQ
jgi:hypothetical protein